MATNAEEESVDRRPSSREYESKRQKYKRRVSKADAVWDACMTQYYPDLQKQTYFIPPCHFNNVLYDIQEVAGQPVLVPSVSKTDLVTYRPDKSLAPQEKNTDGKIDSTQSEKYLDDKSAKSKRCANERSFDLNFLEPQHDKSERCVSETGLVLTRIERSQEGKSERYVDEHGSKRPEMTQDDELQKSEQCANESSLALKSVAPSERLQKDKTQSLPVASQAWLGVTKELFQKAYGKVDVEEDRALHQVLRYLRDKADRFKEVMVVISKLGFRKFLDDQVDGITTANRLHECPAEYEHRGFDFLIISRRLSVIIGEMSAVEDTFMLLGTVKRLIEQVNTAEDVLRYLISDLPPISITKSLILPNLSSELLLEALQIDDDTRKSLCKCLGAKDLKDAVAMCLCKDKLKTDVWWERLKITDGDKDDLTEDLYKDLATILCVPATTVEIPAMKGSAQAFRSLGEAVAETGCRMALITLYPAQVDLVNRKGLWRTFLSGPPGTGKTIVLIIKCMQWLSRGKDVHLISTWERSIAASYLIEHQLRQIQTKGKVHVHMFDLREEGERRKAVDTLVTAAQDAGGELYAIADEAGPYGGSYFEDFCLQIAKRLEKQIFHIWAASVKHYMVPACLRLERLTVPLRSPPAVVCEVAQAPEFRRNEVLPYTMSKTPPPTDIPVLWKFHHGQPGHAFGEPQDCPMCGETVCDVLRELHVEPGGVLEYRDVMILCHEVTAKSALVNVLDSRGIQYHVITDCSDRERIKDVALAKNNVVTVALTHTIFGLERRVVFWVGPVEAGRLDAMSRCTAQLVVIPAHRDDMNQDDTIHYVSSSDRGYRSHSEGYMSRSEASDDDVEIPIRTPTSLVFSEKWQFSGTFTSAGGELQGEDSDVILHIPEGAIPETKGALRKTKGATTEMNEDFLENDITQNDAAESDAMKNDVENDVRVRIYGAVSTDMKSAREKLRLTENERLISPVVEFDARGVIFKKPVMIVLPFFLCSESPDLMVYRLHLDKYGDVQRQRLEPHHPTVHQGQSSTDGTYIVLPEQGQIHIFTTHFTGYACTNCHREMTPPWLRLRVYGTHTQRDSRHIDLSLFIWDTRLDIRDFRKVCLPNQADEENFITTKTLGALENASSLEVGARLALGQREKEFWMFPENTPEPEQRLELQDFVPCCLDPIPERVDWALENIPGKAPGRWFHATIDVGYVPAGEGTLNFLRRPRQKTLVVSGLELKNGSADAQTETETAVKSHASSVPVSPRFQDFSATRAGGREAFVTEMKADSSDNVSFSVPVQDSQVYSMDQLRAGICLIINNKDFSPARQRGIALSDREGTEPDVRELENVFRWLRFNVVKKVNCTAENIQQTLLQQFEFDHSSFDCFVCVIMSHGHREVILGVDGEQVSLQFLKEVNIKRCTQTGVDVPRCLSLVGKPKLFFIQACQGNQSDPGALVADGPTLEAVPPNSPVPQPNPCPPASNRHPSQIPGACANLTLQGGPLMGDVLIYKAAVSGCKSYRHRENGSWFIQTLAAVFNEHAHEWNLSALMTEINGRVGSTQQTPQGCRQQPELYSSLNKTVQFHP